MTTSKIQLAYDREVCVLEVICTNGTFEVLVDYEDSDWICDNNWRVDKAGYVVRGIRREGVYSLLRRHREILIYHGFLKKGEKTYVDHIDNNKLNNQKTNLRLCGQADNNKNRRSKKGNAKGITKTPYGFRVDICVDGISIYLGTYPTEKLANNIYNNAGRQLHKEYFNPTDKT